MINLGMGQQKTPTSRPTIAPTSKPGGGTLSSGCDASSVQITQTQVGSWTAKGQPITQHTLIVSTTCTTKTLVGLVLEASNWNAVSFWNVLSSSSSGNSVLTFPSYFTVTPTSPYSMGYQNAGEEATFTVRSVTFQ